MPESAPAIQLHEACRLDYERCTGCGACFEQCPVHSMKMFPEPG